MAIFDNLGNYRNFGLLIIRVGLGALMIYHGLPKLKGGPEMWNGLGMSMKTIGISFLPIFWGFMAAATETFGGALILLGLAFRPACLLLTFNFIIAALFHFNKGDGWMGASHAVELAVVFAGLLFVGPGKYSVDKK